MEISSSQKIKMPCSRNSSLIYRDVRQFELNEVQRLLAEELSFKFFASVQSVAKSLHLLLFTEDQCLHVGSGQDELPDDQ